MNVQKQLFAERLSKISEELKDKAAQFLYHLTPWAACNSSCDLPSKLEVINCVNCRAHLLTCKDPTLCQGGTQELLLWAMSLGITLPVAVIAGGGWYILWRKKAAKEGPSRLSVPHS
ncbi:PREDICTED: uncharacterized protein LOC107529854 isoform X2 [Miniopterus natalensis]|uniref:uncharacterized protein LOC107529854 isoform X2 n=1 Tax=Miniopterus natalensis TaxID=291302 RepID=UPI0007A6F537|nr:PREDICTED: uncharacterized protein LOC107529854 isoform X2 [Miniopterus natalensis]